MKCEIEILARRRCWISTASIGGRYEGPVLGAVLGPRVASTPRAAAWVELLVDAARPSGGRLVGFDNAHTVRESRGPAGKRRAADHKHGWIPFGPIGFKERVRYWRTFRAEVDKLLKEKGVI